MGAVGERYGRIASTLPVVVASKQYLFYLLVNTYFLAPLVLHAVSAGAQGSSAVLVKLHLRKIRGSYMTGGLVFFLSSF